MISLLILYGPTLFFPTSALVGDDGFGTFTTPLLVEADQVSGRKLKLLEDFIYIDPEGNSWITPAGHSVDGASIPRVFWSITGGPFSGKYRASSVIHDYYCDAKTRPWEDVHRNFYFGMRASGVEENKAKLMFAAVHAFGPRWEAYRTSNKTMIANYKVRNVDGAYEELVSYLEEGDNDIEAIIEFSNSLQFRPKEIRDLRTMLKSDEVCIPLIPDDYAVDVIREIESKSFEDSELGSNTNVRFICTSEDQFLKHSAERNLSRALLPLYELNTLQSGYFVPITRMYSGVSSDVSAHEEDDWRLVQSAATHILGYVSVAEIMLENYQSEYPNKNRRLINGFADTLSKRRELLGQIQGIEPPDNAYWSDWVEEYRLEVEKLSNLLVRSNL